MRITKEELEKRTLLAALKYLLNNQKSNETAYLTRTRYTAAVKRFVMNLKKRFLNDMYMTLV